MVRVGVEARPGSAIALIHETRETPPEPARGAGHPAADTRRGITAWIAA